LSLQRCEGSKLESVLEEVRARFGDTVTIVEANRLRKGGVGGFFARERYEVVVDIDDEFTELPETFGLEATEDFCEHAGIPTSAAGVAGAYRDVLDGIVADEAADGLPGLVTDTLMDTAEDRARLANEVLGFAASLGDTS